MEASKFYTFLAVGLGLMLMVTWLCGLVIALKQGPGIRAFWTTLPGYVIIVGMSLPDDNFPVWADFIMHAPAAIAIYFILLFSYRSAWIEDNAVPEGMALANADWRKGAIIVAMLGGWALGHMAFRALSGG